MSAKTMTIAQLLQNKNRQCVHANADVFAPINIALCKYWGKRDELLNLPINDSLSITVPDLGIQAILNLDSHAETKIIVNQETLPLQSAHAQKLINYIRLFTADNFDLTLNSNVPLAAGFASSAALFAAIIQALNYCYQWQLNSNELSILARLGSGSASRSVFENGFVHWHKGERPDGMDSFATRLPNEWPELRIGLIAVQHAPKKTSSRDGMLHTKNTSLLYKSWPEQAARDLPLLKTAIETKNFLQLGEAAENNALAMHATMLAAKPALIYSTPDTWQMIEQVWRLRESGLTLYFTQDAGANLKLLFLQPQEVEIRKHFPSALIQQLF